VVHHDRLLLASDRVGIPFWLHRQRKDVLYCVDKSVEMEQRRLAQERSSKKRKTPYITYVVPKKVVKDKPKEEKEVVSDDHMDYTLWFNEMLPIQLVTGIDHTRDEDTNIPMSDPDDDVMGSDVDLDNKGGVVYRDIIPDINADNDETLPYGEDIQNRNSDNEVTTPSGKDIQSNQNPDMDETVAYGTDTKVMDPDNDITMPYGTDTEVMDPDNDITMPYGGVTENDIQNRIFPYEELEILGSVDALPNPETRSQSGMVRDPEEQLKIKRRRQRIREQDDVNNHVMQDDTLLSMFSEEYVSRAGRRRIPTNRMDL